MLDGRIQLSSLLGGSRFSRTWVGALGTQRVAVQELPLGFADPREISELVQHEVGLLRAIRHPGVVRTHEGLIGRMGSRWALFIVQDYIDGATLEQEVGTGRFTLEEVLDVIDEVSTTLDHLHGLNPPLLHRNIKPANIVRRRSDGSLVLIDFGAVRDILRDLDGRPGAGADGYASPEQRRGRLDPKTDLYGLGVTAVRLLTGLRPAELINPDTGQLDWGRHVQVGASVQWLLQGLIDADPSRRVRNTRELDLRLKTVRGPKRGAKTPSKPKRGPAHPFGDALAGGLKAVPLRGVGDLADAETVLYEGDEKHLMGVGELSGEDETFYGLREPGRTRPTPQLKPGRPAVAADPRPEGARARPTAQTLVAEDSDIEDSDLEDGGIEDGGIEDGDLGDGGLGGGPGRDGELARRLADPFPEEAETQEEPYGLPPPPDQPPVPVVFKTSTRPPPPLHHTLPPQQPAARQATRPPPEAARQATRPPPEAARPRSALPPPMPSVGPTPAELARGPASPAPPPFRAARSGATLPPPASPTLEPIPIPPRAPPPPTAPRAVRRSRPREGLVVSKGVALVLAALLVATTLGLILTIIMLLAR